MPRKKRDIRRDYRQAKFLERPGKDDHTIFYHPLVRNPVSVDGKDGADAKDYDEQALRRALSELREALEKKSHED
jgi:hypothetical protein